MLGERTCRNYNSRPPLLENSRENAIIPRMRQVAEILESPRLSAPLAEGQELLRLQDAAQQALAELGMDIPCRVALAGKGELELRARDAAAATRLKQTLPSFLAAFNRRAQVDMRSARVRVAPEK